MRILTTTAAAIAMMAILLPASPAHSTEAVRLAGPVRFTYVQYDSPGADRGSNRSLNAEWIRVKNVSRTTRSLSGWIIRDPVGHRYVFPQGSRLGPGNSVTVHTGRGTNHVGHKYWRRDWYVWNNTGDRATLKNRSGQVVDRCGWGDGDGSRPC